MNNGPRQEAAAYEPEPLDAGAAERQVEAEKRDMEALTAAAIIGDDAAIAQLVSEALVNAGRLKPGATPDERVVLAVDLLAFRCKGFAARAQRGPIDLLRLKHQFRSVAVTL